MTAGNAVYNAMTHFADRPTVLGSRPRRAISFKNPLRKPWILLSFASAGGLDCESGEYDEICWKDRYQASDRIAFAIHHKSTDRLGSSKLCVKLGNHGPDSIDQVIVRNLPIKALAVNDGLYVRRIRHLPVRHRGLLIQILLLTLALVLILILLQHLSTLLLVHHRRLVLVHLHILGLELLLWILVHVLRRSHGPGSTRRHLPRQIGSIWQS